MKHFVLRWHRDGLLRTNHRTVSAAVSMARLAWLMPSTTDVLLVLHCDTVARERAPRCLP